MSEERSGLVPGSWSGMEILAKVPPPAFFVRCPGLMQIHPSTLCKEWTNSEGCWHPICWGCRKIICYSTQWVLQSSPCWVKPTTRRSSLNIKTVSMDITIYPLLWLVRASDQHSEDPGSNPGRISMSFFSATRYKVDPSLVSWPITCYISTSLFKKQVYIVTSCAGCNHVPRLISCLFLHFLSLCEVRTPEQGESHQGESLISLLFTH